MPDTYFVIKVGDRWFDPYPVSAGPWDSDGNRSVMYRPSYTDSIDNARAFTREEAEDHARVLRKHEAAWERSPRPGRPPRSVEIVELGPNA